uniref:Uncharacterized protein n=1 Tax=Arundo donax TaxID=35708 RepID=A0A0A9GK90_ARUDO
MVAIYYKNLRAETFTSTDNITS